LITATLALAATGICLDLVAWQCAGPENPDCTGRRAWLGFLHSGFFAPTGRYTANNANGDNTGLGMWGFEPSVGATVHLNESKTWNASALASFEFHTDKRDTSRMSAIFSRLKAELGAVS